MENKVVTKVVRKKKAPEVVEATPLSENEVLVVKQKVARTKKVVASEKVEQTSETIGVTETPTIHPLRFFPLAIGIFFLFTISATLYFLSPETIISYIGISNAYGLIFVLAFLGGMMTFSGVPYHLILVAFVASGLNPYLLGVLAGLGVTMGDSTSYFLGYFGRAALTGHMQKILEKMEYYKEKYPRILPVIFFSYASLVPFSSDVLTIPAGLIRYPFWRLMIPLALGSMVFNITLALLGAYAYDFVKGFF